MSSVVVAALARVRASIANLRSLPRSVGMSVDGGGSVIQAGQKGFVQCPFAGRIMRWTLLADQPGSCVVDVWRAAFEAAPPTEADSITASGKPILDSEQRASGLTNMWAKDVDAGDVFGFNVESASGMTRLSLVLWISV